MLSYRYDRAAYPGDYEKKGVSPRNLALRMKISESTIYRTLREERSPTIEEVEMFAKALDVPIGEILTIKEELHE